MKQCFFAVDLGATSGRTILGTFTSNGLEMKSKPFPKSSD